MTKIIYLAGGCFWGVQEYYRRLKGIVSTRVGYANGNSENPTYADLTSQKADHAETVELVYDEGSITLEKICEHLLRIINPYAIDHQGEDYGHQYRTAIFYTDPADGERVSRYIRQQERAVKQKFAILIEPLLNFYAAEDYHQDYLQVHPNGYCHVDFSKIQDGEKK